MNTQSFQSKPAITTEIARKIARNPEASFNDSRAHDVVDGSGEMIERTVSELEGGAPTARQMSIFQENFEYARKTLGYTYIESKCYAIDYYRKFTAKERTENFDVMTEGLQDESVSAFDHVLFNELVTKMDEAADLKQAQFLYLVVRQQDLERYLDRRNLLRCVEVCGSEEPEEVKDIAKVMGFTVRANGSCNSMARYRRQLQELFSGLFPDEAAKYAKVALS
jgi:hypothetical protein